MACFLWLSVIQCRKTGRRFYGLQKFFNPCGRSCLPHLSGVKGKGAKRQDGCDVSRTPEQRAAGEGDKRTRQGPGRGSVKGVPVQPASPAISSERLLRPFTAAAVAISPPEKVTCSHRTVRRSAPHGLLFCVSCPRLCPRLLMGTSPFRDPHHETNQWTQEYRAGGIPSRPVIFLPGSQDLPPVPACQRRRNPGMERKRISSLRPSVSWPPKVGCARQPALRCAQGEVQPPRGNRKKHQQGESRPADILSDIQFMNRYSITANWAREAVPWGFSVVAEVPLRMPALTAQSMAASA